MASLVLSGTGRQAGRSRTPAGRASSASLLRTPNWWFKNRTADGPAAAEETAADPNDPTAHQWYGDFLAGRGRLEESLAEMARAHQLDPLSRQIGAEWAWVSYLLRRNDEAESHIRQVLALDPNYAQAHARLGFIEIQQHRYPEAIASIKRSIDLGMFYPYVAAALVQAYAGAGDSAAARRVIDDLLLLAEGSEPDEWENQIVHVPL